MGIATILEAKKILDAGTKPIPTRVVSFPSWELFETQPRSYQESVLLPGVPVRIAVEAAVSQGWDRYLGSEGEFVGMNGFGASAPIADLMTRFGLTPENVVERARKIVQRTGRKE